MASIIQPQDSSQPGTGAAIADDGKDRPLIAASVEIDPKDQTSVSDAAALALGSSQLIDIADGGAGHVKTQP